MKLKMLELQKLPTNFWRTNLKLMTVLLLTFFAFACKKEKNANNQLPTLTTKVPSNGLVLNGPWKSGGTITNSGSDSVTARGICWSTAQNPTIADPKTADGAGSGTFTSSLSGLAANTKYYVRAYATNSVGTAYGNEQSFTNGSIIVLPDRLPILSTVTPYNITGSTSGCGGSSISNFGTAITEKGVCWSTTANPTIADSKKISGTGNGDFNSYITGLTFNTTYHVRAYATNGAGTAYGNDLSFKTKNEILDIDGNVYQVVKINNQYWLQENLKTTRYNDGTAITFGLNSATWENTSAGVYSYYNNDPANNTTYGKLYNWHAVNTGKLAPAGWHVPTDAEWNNLVNYLGGTNIAGSKMKATTLWNPVSGIISSNSSYFTAFPGGAYNTNVRGGGGSFEFNKNSGLFWASNQFNADYGWRLMLRDNNSIADVSFFYKASGLSVRCVKD